MAPGKDMRRPDLGACRAPPPSPGAGGGPSADDAAAAVVPYQEPSASGGRTEFSSTLASTMPMAAMFTRNKYVGWCVSPSLGARPSG